MKKILVLFFVLLLILTACTSEANNITNQNAIVFEDEEVPASMYQLLESKKIIHIGEYHNHDAHAEFLTQLVLKLENHNLLLLEMSHALEWLVEDYTLGKIDAMPAFMEQFNQVDFHEIRAYNQLVDEHQKIRVKTIDINHAPQFLAMSLKTMIELGYIEATEPILAYLKNHDADEDAINLKAYLNNERDSLVSKWGEIQYEQINNMLNREVESIYCRKPLENGDEALRAIRRETVMKNNVENILSINEGPVIINTGFYHTQKKHYLGTEQEWLGEYLKFESPNGKDNTYQLVVIPIEGAITWSDDGSIKRKSSILDYSGNDELFKSMLKFSEGKSVFLDYNSSNYFMTEKMKMNFHYHVIETIPSHLFDGSLLLSQGFIW